MKPKQQLRPDPIDLIDLVKNSGRIQSLTRCCGRTASMDNVGYQAENKESREAFIFGSWKRRSRRRPAAVTVTVRPVSIVTDENERNNNQSKPSFTLPSSQRSSTYYPSSQASSCTTKCQDNMDILQEESRSNVEHLEEEDFWCPRCGRKMQAPRLLSCLHPICTPCIDELVNRASYGSYSDNACNNSYAREQSSNIREGCPICDFPLSVPGSPVPPPHYPLQHRLVMDAVRRRLAHQVLCCDACLEEVQASVHCPTCLRNFCSDCGTEHQEREIGIVTGSSLHEVRPLWEAKSVRRTALCLVHPSHALRFHCIACKQATCRECMWRGSHRGHASEGAAGAGRRAAALLTKALQKARTLLNSLLVEYNDQVFSNGTADRPRSLYNNVENDRNLYYHLSVFVLIDYELSFRDSIVSEGLVTYPVTRPILSQETRRLCANRSDDNVQEM